MQKFTDALVNFSSKMANNEYPKLDEVRASSKSS